MVRDLIDASSEPTRIGEFKMEPVRILRLHLTWVTTHWRRSIVLRLSRLCCSCALPVGLWCCAAGCDSTFRGAPSGTGRGGAVGRTKWQSLIDESAAAARYVVFAPRGKTRCSRPVIVFLNGASENGDDGTKQISNNFGVQVWEMQQFFPFIAVAPQCRKSWSDAGEDEAMALRIVDSVVKEFGGDPDRVYLTGVSSGGSGTWSIASRHPGRFAAIVPLCGEGGASVRKLAEARVPVWCFYNELDGANVVAFNRRNREALIELGQSPLMSEFHEAGHDCWNRAYRSTAMYGWLLTQSLARNTREKPFEYWRSERLVRDWIHVGAARWDAGAEGELVGRDADEPDARHATNGGGETQRAGEAPRVVHSRPQVGGCPAADDTGTRRAELARGVLVPGGLLVADAAALSVECHADVWLDGDGVARIAMVSGVDATDSAFVVSVALPDAGTGGVLDGEGGWRARIDPAAQRVLRAGAWNDLRVRLADGHLSVHLNGWPAADVALQEDEAGREYRAALVAPGAAGEGRWRYVRTRGNFAN